MAQGKWELDAAHSEIEFKVKHMMITNVKGNFDIFKIEVDAAGEDFKNALAKVVIDTASINTRNEQRDGHLKSAEFFDVEKYPEITFEATSLENDEIKGNLTIRDVTKPVSFDLEFAGLQKDPWGNTKAGFIVEGKIKRSEFGLSWNAALETGGVMVSDEVKFSADIQLIKAQ
ncbi:YceI family protein [Sphingobacterium zeae]|uniref:Polyisoprenoid-binding protein YceI n=1 Tax=Sphingobacterium zeae TaxID=1776859 RepID=A0ABU0U918_9SPHI|nr:YceI family protein [Sphingobacterium zeae]MDQ1151031.1 polyisoprenoid-binding protein YceI [Sphingobacterium zeae]